MKTTGPVRHRHLGEHAGPGCARREVESVAVAEHRAAIALDDLEPAGGLEQRVAARG